MLWRTLCPGRHPRTTTPRLQQHLRQRFRRLPLTPSPPSQMSGRMRLLTPRTPPAAFGRPACAVSSSPHTPGLPLQVAHTLEAAFTPVAATAQPVDFAELARLQATCPEVAAMCRSDRLQVVSQPVGDVQLLGDICTGSFCPLVPPQLRERIANSLHSIHHPGVKATKRLVAARFCGLSWLNRWQPSHVPACSANMGRCTNTYTCSRPPSQCRIAASPTYTWIWLVPCLPPAVTCTCSQSSTGRPGGRRRSRWHLSPPRTAQGRFSQGG